MRKPTGNYQVMLCTSQGYVSYVHTNLGPLTFHNECFANDFALSLVRDQAKALEAGYITEDDVQMWCVKHCPNLPIGFTFKAAGWRYHMATNPSFMITYAYLGGADCRTWKYHVGLVISTESGDIAPEYEAVYGPRKELHHNIDGRTYVDWFNETEEEIRKVMLP